MTKKILFINSCIRGKEISRTYKICNYIINQLKALVPGLYVQEVNLDVENIAPMNSKRLEKRDVLTQKGDFSDDIFKFAKDFAAADIIIVGAPYWDLSFPALLKIYVENICANGITFKYSETGVPIGLCRGTDLLFISTSGGYLDKENNGYSYFCDISKLFNIQNTYQIIAQGLDVWGTDVEEKINTALSQGNELCTIVAEHCKE